MSTRSRRTLGSALTLGILIAVPLASYTYSHLSPAATTREIHIAAPPEKVWETLTDFDSYADWNPHVIRAAGDVAVDSRLSITVAEGDSATDFAPRVLVADPGRELRWRGSFLMPGLADGTHSFVLEPAHGGTRLIQSEFFTGVLGPLTPFLFDLATSFDAANAALRERVEGQR